MDNILILKSSLRKNICATFFNKNTRSLGGLIGFLKIIILIPLGRKLPTFKNKKILNIKT